MESGEHLQNLVSAHIHTMCLFKLPAPVFKTPFVLEEKVKYQVFQCSWIRQIKLSLRRFETGYPRIMGARGNS